MLQPAACLRRFATSPACVCLPAVVCGNLAAAPRELHVGGDLDGDGGAIGSRSIAHIPTFLNVWLSSSQTTWTVRSCTPSFASLSDLDGDNRPELITRGKEPGLTVWTRKKHQGFKRYHPRHPNCRQSPAPLRTPFIITAESDRVRAGLVARHAHREPAACTCAHRCSAVDSLLVDACRAVVLAVFAPRPPPAFA